MDSKKNLPPLPPFLSGNSLRLRDIFIILRNRWPVGFAFGFGVSFLFYVFTSGQPERYRSIGTLIVEVNPERIIELQNIGAGDENVRAYDTVINAYLERLKSRSMSKFILKNMQPRHLEKLKKAYSKARDHDLEDEPELSVLAGYLRAAMKAEWNARIHIITISAEHRDPELAQLIAKAYCEGLIQIKSQRLEERTQNVLAFLETQAERLQSKLQEGEERLQAYRRENNLGSIEGDIDLVGQRLIHLSNAMTEEEVRLISARSQLEQLESAEDNPEELVRVSFVSRDSLIESIQRKLDDLRDEREVLANTYGPRHPRMLKNQALIESTEAKMENSLGQVIEKARDNLKAIQSNYVGIQKEMAAAESEAMRLDDLAIQYRLLERKLDVQRQIFDVVSEQLMATDASSQFDMASIRTLDPPTRPGAPYAPDRQKILLASVGLFLVIFLGLPVVLDLLDHRLRTFADIESFVRKPVYGCIQYLGDKSEQPLREDAASEDTRLATSFLSLYSALRLKMGDESSSILMVTSAVPNEGKSFVASNLAAIYARHHKRVLLLDCDFRRPSISSLFGLNNDRGVLDWLNSPGTGMPRSSEMLSDDHLGITSVSENLWVLTSGGTTHRATEIIGQDRFNQLIWRLKELFEIIIVDTPPAGLFPDAFFLAEFADQTLFVARQNEVSRYKARFVVDQFEATPAPVGGVVLNAVVDRYAAELSGGYGRRADSYAYGYESTAKKYQKYYEAEKDF